MDSQGISTELTPKDRVNFEANYPGLLDALDKGENENLETPSEDFTRNLLNSIKDLPEFKKEEERLPDDLRKLLEDFMGGKGVEDLIDDDKPFEPPLKYPALEGTQDESFWSPVSRVEKIGTMQKIKAEPFTNWGKTVSLTPEFTYIPTKVSEVQDVVKQAKAAGKRVRVSGFRHTWTNMYPEHGEWLISLMDLPLATGSSKTVSQHALKGRITEFNQIGFYGGKTPGPEDKKCLVSVGAAVTNEALRLWSIKNLWTLPLNVIMVEITAGGANAPICHGAGIRHNTLSDLVREINYVDANGMTQSISFAEPELLRAAAGAFGLLGIVTSLVFEFDRMTYADLAPEKVDVLQAIPPPAKYMLPNGLKMNETQRESAEKRFIQKARDSYYAEWFWFPYNSKVFVNCWNNTTESAGYKHYPPSSQITSQWFGSFMANVTNKAFRGGLISGKAQGLVNGGAAMIILPTEKVRTTLIDGLHFQRGIQNFNVLCAEFNIPIPALKNDSTKPDWSIVQRAWWDAISIVYDDKEQTGALRVVLELRIIGGSSTVIMAPQANNKFGTVSIEVISNLASGDKDVWKKFVQRLVDKWMTYDDENGKPLNIRPHWAKQWEDYNVGKVPMKEHLKKVAYKDEIPEFTKALTRIGAKQGWELKDIKERFSNPLLDYLFFN